ncbi:Mbov_0397 family ICE element conjugal transfer ATPase [Mycoplasma sp. 392]
MKQPSNLRRVGTYIFRKFSWSDIIVFMIFAIFSFMFCFTVLGNVATYIKAIVTICMLALLSVLLINSPKNDCRLYCLLFRKIMFLFATKKFKKDTKQDTRLLITYKEIDKDAIIQNDNGSYTQLIKFIGKNIWKEHEADIQRFINIFYRSLDNFDANLSIFKIRNSSVFNKNIEYLEKEAEIAIDNPYIVKNQVVNYYQNLEDNFDMLEENSFGNSYYLAISTSSKKLTQEQTKVIIDSFNDSGIYTFTLSQQETIEVLARINDIELDKDKLQEYLDKKEVQISKPKATVVNEKITVKKFIKDFAKNIGIVKDKKVDSVAREENGNSITLKDLLANEEVEFKNGYVIKDDIYYKYNLVTELANDLSQGWLSVLLESDSDTIIHLNKIQNQKLEKLMQLASVKVKASLIDNKNKFSSSVLSQELEAIEFMLEQLTSQKMSLWDLQIITVDKAYSKEELLEINSKNYREAKRERINLAPLNTLQIKGYSYSHINRPLNKNVIQITSENFASGWYFVNDEINDFNSLYLGNSVSTYEPIIFDMFYRKDKKRVNHNMFVVGSSGAGKTTMLGKLALNMLFTNKRLYVIDPQNEYTALGKKLGAQIIRLDAGSNTTINPLELQIILSNPDENLVNNKMIEIETILKNNIAWLENFLYIALDGITENKKIFIFKTINQLYKDWKVLDIRTLEEFKNFTWPTMSDLINKMREALNSKENLDKQVLIKEVISSFEYRFEDYGKYETMFNGKTNINLESDFVIFDTSQLSNSVDESKNLGLFILLSFLQNKIYTNFYQDKNKDTLIVIDELHKYIANSTNTTTLEFIYNLVKTVRKFNCGVLLCTQNPADFFANPATTEKSLAIMNNCQYRLFLMLRQDDIKSVSKMFESNGGLTEAEQRFLANAQVGQGIFSLNSSHKLPLILHYNEFERENLFRKGNFT